jgi:HAMP domain-containing protein
VELTPKEFDLLLLLAANPGRSYSRKELLDSVWGTGFEGYEHTITTHINRLRIKIEPDFNHPVLHSHHLGHRLPLRGINMMDVKPATPLNFFSKTWFSGLYWQLSLTFLAVLTLLAGTYVYITVNSARQYFEAAQQRLNSQVAGRIVQYMSPFVEDGVDEGGVQRIFFNAMVINPSIEVYLLDTAGRILTYHTPGASLLRKKVALQPVERYITSGQTLFIRGDDPRSETREKIFSAARVARNGRLSGYVYVVLTGELYDSALALLLGEHITRLVSHTLAVTLGVTFVIGLVAFWFITRNLTAITSTVRRFREGDLTARIRLRATGELAQLAQTFNQLADGMAAHLEELKTLEKMRRELVANISHDLRTPVTAIHGYAETLWLKKNGLTPTERDDYTHIILQSAGKLRNLVEELFELSN